MECLALVRLNFPAMNQLQLVSVRVNLGEYMRQLFENLKVIDLYVSLLNLPSLLTTKVTLTSIIIGYFLPYLRAPYELHMHYMWYGIGI